MATHLFIHVSGWDKSYLHTEGVSEVYLSLRNTPNICVFFGTDSFKRVSLLYCRCIVVVFLLYCSCLMYCTGCPKSHCAKVRAYCSACDHLIRKISSGILLLIMRGHIYIYICPSVPLVIHDIYIYLCARLAEK